MFHLQAQPLSLEELLAKKKAEEEAEAKVRMWRSLLVGRAAKASQTEAHKQFWRLEAKIMVSVGLFL